jgi:hypothetical protein
MDSPPVIADVVESRIVVIRGVKVLLDSALADLYGVPTKALLQAVRRNAARFPPDFVFKLSDQEVADLRSQIVTSSGYGGRRYVPVAFTEQGVAMPSSVLRSPRAVLVNIEIMRAFVRMRQMVGMVGDLAIRLCEAERIGVWDAFLVASAATAGCGRLLTEDLAHGRVLAGVRIVNPFLPVAEGVEEPAQTWADDPDDWPTLRMRA